MDAVVFDQIARLLSGSSSRRGLLPGLIAMGLATSLSPSADARKRKKRKKCKGGKKKCGKKCIPKGNCCSDASCGSGGVTCQNGACLCSVGQRGCQGICIPDGDCCANGDCGGGAACADGACLCLDGFRTCQDRCISDDACCIDGDCPDGVRCEDGVCGCPVAGQVACGDSCVNLATNGGNCGACGVACATNQTCSNGACSCVAVTDCPGEGCGCAGRLEGGFACFRSGGQPVSCAGDADCPLGTFCINAGFCSLPCLG